MRYLAVLVLVVTLPTLLYIYADISGGVEKLAKQVNQSWPDFRLAQGHLQVYSESPLIIDNGDGSLTIIDTTGKSYREIFGQYPQANCIITRDQIFQRQQLQVRIIDFKMLKYFTFTKKNLITLMSYFQWFGVITVILGFPFLYLFKILEALAFALVAMLLGLITRTRLNYQQAFNISVYALTVPFIVQGLQKAFWPNFAYPNIIFYAVLLLYVVIGVSGAARSRIVL